LDIGAVKGNGQEFHSDSLQDFSGFLRGSKYICGHNILNHDLKYLKKEIEECGAEYFIDTLYLSPLMFPKKPYHHLVKDDKLTADELNNPLNDAKKARDLFHDEVAKFEELDGPLKKIYYALLNSKDELMNLGVTTGYRFKKMR